MFKYFSNLFMCIVLISCTSESTYAKEAQIQIKNIYSSAVNFYQKNGIMPSDCYEEMAQAGAIEMKQSVIDSWEFQCDWFFDDDEREIIGTITATSTEQNKLGANKVVAYNIESGEYTGYGQANDE